MRYLILAAMLLSATACAATGGNSNIDYRATSFATVNSCTHTTALYCS